MDILKINFSVQIFGTDIGVDAIDVARTGVFPSNIEDIVSKERLTRFFIKENTSYKIKNEIRKMIIFASQNLVKDPPFTKLDLLSCRNLLIYLSPALQKKLLPLFYYSLRPNGILFLGTSETIRDSYNLFTTIDRRWKIYRRTDKNLSLGSIPDLLYTSPPEENNETKITDKVMPDVDFHLSNLVDHILIDTYAPACVVINENNKIIHISGRTSKFLELAQGPGRLYLMDMVRAELKSRLSAALNNAKLQQKEIVLNGLQLKDGTQFKTINLKVKPIGESEGGKLFLVIFEEIPETKENETLLKKGKKTVQYDKLLAQLEHELKYTKENLQTTIEELETSNEELKSSNEELQSTNEELQSTNEEIETSKEELQSLNEELTTVNVELEGRIEQLSTANDDIKNLLDNTEIATIFLDNDLCIKRYTPKATNIVNLISTDIGRPIGHIVSNLKYDKLVEDSKKVLKTYESKTIEVVDKAGQWSLVRIIPYRTITNIIDGVVITFSNIHIQKSTETTLRKLKNDLNYLKKINQALLSFPIVVLDENEKIMFVNNQFCEAFNVKAEDVIASTIFNLKLDWDKSALKAALNGIQTPVSIDKVNVFAETPNYFNAYHVDSSEILLIIKPE